MFWVILVIFHHLFAVVQFGVFPRSWIGNTMLTLCLFHAWRVSSWMIRVVRRERQDFGTWNFVTSHSSRIPGLRKGWHHTALCNAVISTFLTINNFSQSHSNQHFSANYNGTTSIIWIHGTTVRLSVDWSRWRSIPHSCMRLRNAYTLIRQWGGTSFCGTGLSSTVLVFAFLS